MKKERTAYIVLTIGGQNGFLSTHAPGSIPILVLTFKKSRAIMPSFEKRLQIIGKTFPTRFLPIGPLKQAVYLAG